MIPLANDLSKNSSSTYSYRINIPCTIWSSDEVPLYYYASSSNDNNFLSCFLAFFLVGFAAELGLSVSSRPSPTAFRFAPLGFTDAPKDRPCCLGAFDSADVDPFEGWFFVALSAGSGRGGKPWAEHGDEARYHGESTILDFTHPCVSHSQLPSPIDASPLSIPRSEASRPSRPRPHSLVHHRGALEWLDAWGSGAVQSHRIQTRRLRRYLSPHHPYHFASSVETRVSGTGRLAEMTAERESVPF